MNWSGAKLANGLLILAKLFGIWYAVSNDGSWLVFEVMEFADDGVFGLEEDREFGI